MSQTICVAAMVKDEASNYLPSALDAWREFSDHIIVLDDQSTDGTADLCREAGCYVLSWTGSPAWGHETPPRRHLWEAAVQSGHDWIFVLDADMVPAKDPRELLLGGIDGVGFTLFDLWDDHSYRSDFYWRGHEVSRLWLVRNPRTTGNQTWTGRGIHSGHLPQNLRLERILQAPREYSLLHYAYATADDREKKIKQYMARGHQLTLHEWAHAASITSEEPSLLPLDIDISWPLTKSS